MKVALFIPCYIDQFYPQVGIATLELLEKLGLAVSFPRNQTCCGQPMANSGFEHQTAQVARLFSDTFSGYDYIVCPSGSCALHVRDHYSHFEQTEQMQQVRARTFELCQFLTDVLKVSSLPASFPYRVGLHQSCHGQRGLRLSQSSEIVGPAFSRPRQLLEMVKGLELIPLDRTDECCGFGGTFAVDEEAVSVKMGKDRLADHQRNGAQVITGADMSCLMHLNGLASRNHQPIRFMHIAEILNSNAHP